MAVAIDFDADFDAQIAQARAQRVVLPKEFYRLPPEKRAQAFTVSGLARLDQVQAVADALAKFQAEGSTFEDFRKWALQQDWSLPRHRLETIYRNAVQTAYMAGHWRRFDEVKDDLPYLMYDAINDSRTRPSHLAMDGVIRPVDDPIWRTWSPPCGFRCRCTLRQVSAREAQRRGGVTQSIPAEAVPDDGWGGDPRQWGQTLREIASKRLRACQAGVAGLSRKSRPASQNMDCTSTGSSVLADLISATPASVFVMDAVRWPQNKQPPLELGSVSQPAVERGHELGVQLQGKMLALDHDSVIHIIRAHGSERERLRGQHPIDSGDLELWAAIFNAAELRIGKPPKTKDGAIVLAGRSILGEWVYGFAAKVRRRHVVPHTLFKRKLK